MSGLLENSLFIAVASREHQLQHLIQHNAYAGYPTYATRHFLLNLMLR